MHLGWLSNARTDGVANGADVGRPEPFELSVIDIITTDGGRRLAWIVTNGRRTSDWLNAEEPLPLRAAQEVELADVDVAPPPTPTDTIETDLGSTDVLFVIPPPLPANRHLRLHRRRVHVSLQMGGFEISGDAHVRPGAEIGAYLFRSGRRFLPLTEVEVVSSTEPAFRWTLPVVIVNAAHVEEVHGLAPVLLGGEETPVAEIPVLETPELEEAEPDDEPFASRSAILMTALEILLAEGLLDIVEFQEKRATLATG